ncbi:MAG: MBL fold metallo-hydrolase [Polyangiaceae bacterium]|nr:MBL fold metallo-hydrolase [Polyangiaceae bacterium]
MDKGAFCFASVRLVHLGHATWLVDAAGLRLLCDPLLGQAHSGGTFATVPRRTIEASSTRADFIIVSHAHPDHFDPESLAALARVDADTVVITPEPLVAEVARIVGFRTVREVAPGTRVDLDGLSLVTTPSRAPDVELGVVFLDRAAAVWNMIDTVFDTPNEVRQIREAAVGDRRLDVALVPVQPMREIALATAGHVGFDARQYLHMLACAKEADSACYVPSAAGDAHAPPFDAMNAWVYPVSRERAAADLARFAPSARVLMPDVGDAMVVEGGAVAVERGDVDFELLGGDPSRSFRPLEPAPLVDPNLLGLPASTYKERIVAWLRSDLAPALASTLGRRDDLGDLRLSLEIVSTDGREGFSFDRFGRIRDGIDPEYEVLVVAAASMLWEVIEGRRGWGEPLLAGLLRSSVRGISIVGDFGRPLSIAPIFLYYALSYGESVRRAAIHRAREAVSQ